MSPVLDDKKYYYALKNKGNGITLKRLAIVKTQDMKTMDILNCYTMQYL